MLRGADILAGPWPSHHRPAGRAVLIGRPLAHPLLCRQGYAIAKLVDLADPLAQLGVQALREVALAHRRRGRRRHQPRRSC